MTIKSDLAALDWAYRARRTGQSKADWPFRSTDARCIPLAAAASVHASPSGEQQVELAHNLTAREICQAANPGADDDWCEYILWSRTCYPFGRVTARDLYRAASTIARAQRRGLVLCDFCDALARPDSGTCAECDAALRRNLEEVAA